MSEPLNTVSDTNTGSQNNIKPNFKFVRSHVGSLMVVNMILLFFAWVMMAGFKENSNFTNFSSLAPISFFLVTTVIPWLTLVIVYLVFLLELHTKLQINWPLTLYITCSVWATLLCISSSIVIILGINDFPFTAAMVFGFFSVFGLAIQGFFHFKEFRNPV